MSTAHARHLKPEQKMWLNFVSPFTVCFPLGAGSEELSVTETSIETAYRTNR